jgi:hypothetical protein
LGTSERVNKHLDCGERLRIGCLTAARVTLIGWQTTS